MIKFELTFPADMVAELEKVAKAPSCPYTLDDLMLCAYYISTNQLRLCEETDPILRVAKYLEDCQLKSVKTGSEGDFFKWIKVWTYQKPTVRIIRDDSNGSGHGDDGNHGDN